MSICKYFINLSTVILVFFQRQFFNTTVSPIIAHHEFFHNSLFSSLSPIHNIHIQTWTLSQIASFSTESIQSFPWYKSFWIVSSFSKFMPVSLATSATLHKLANQIPSSIIHPPSLFPSLSHGTLILLLLAGDVELNPGPSPLNFTHLNIRSIRSFQKSSSLHNYLANHPTDILSLNETWTYWLWQCCFISGTSWLFNLTFSSSHWSRWWSCSHFSIIPEIQTSPLSQLISTWIFWTNGY